MTARTWRIRWPRISPTIRRYQEPVTRERVLGEHPGALSAEPVEQLNSLQQGGRRA